MNNKELIDKFREAFRNLPDEVKEKEVRRLYMITNNKRIVVLEDHELGKVFKFYDVEDLKKFLFRSKGIEVSKSYLYRVLEGQYSSVKGFKIMYEEIEI